MRSLLLTCLLLVPACTYHTNVRVTKNLAPGMTTEQVRAVMGGDPASTSFQSDHLIWKYTLAQPWVGNVPYYLIFNRETEQLEGWAANDAELRRNQQSLFQTWGMLNRTFPPTQKSKITIKRKR